MKSKKDIKLLQKAEYYSSTEYPMFVEYATRQQHSNWLHTDASVEVDLHSILTEMTNAERHAIINVLKLFVHYELRLGSNFWAKIGEVFPRAEVQRMGSTFAAMEISVHSPFYAEVNRLLSLDNPEFYLEYKNNSVLKSRMEFIESNCKLGKNDSVLDYLKTLATFTMLEGIVLYSSFSLLKSFQANGFNKIPNVVTGVDYVVIDEQIHTEGAASLYHRLIHEAELEEYRIDELQDNIINILEAVVGHEFEIIDIIFEEGDLPSVTKLSMKKFILSRANLVLEYLGIPPKYEIKDDSVSSWFYKNINAPSLVDFFNRNATSYTRDWNENKLAWVN
jgi:ribonucleotide reductase beta subunit family protein with ferritin-like domain